MAVAIAAERPALLVFDDFELFLSDMIVPWTDEGDRQGVAAQLADAAMSGRMCCMKTLRCSRYDLLLASDAPSPSGGFGEEHLGGILRERWTHALDVACAGLFAFSGADELEVLNITTRNLSGHRRTAASGVDGGTGDFGPIDRDVKFRFMSARRGAQFHQVSAPGRVLLKADVKKMFLAERQFLLSLYDCGGPEEDDDAFGRLRAEDGNITYKGFMEDLLGRDIDDFGHEEAKRVLATMTKDGARPEWIERGIEGAKIGADELVVALRTRTRLGRALEAAVPQEGGSAKCNDAFRAGNRRLSAFVNATLSKAAWFAVLRLMMANVKDVQGVTMQGDALICTAPSHEEDIHEEELRRTSDAVLKAVFGDAASAVVRRGRTIKELEMDDESEEPLRPLESHYNTHIRPGMLLGHEVEHRIGINIARREHGRALVVRADLARRVDGIGLLLDLQFDEFKEMYESASARTSMQRQLEKAAMPPATRERRMPLFASVPGCRAGRGFDYVVVPSRFFDDLTDGDDIERKWCEGGREVEVKSNLRSTAVVAEVLADRLRTYGKQRPVLEVHHTSRGGDAGAVHRQLNAYHAHLRVVAVEHSFDSLGMREPDPRGDDDRDDDDRDDDDDARRQGGEHATADKEFNDWTAGEIQRLTEAVEEVPRRANDNYNWVQIAERVGGTRTNEDCRSKWTRGVSNDRVGVPWTEEEDQKLMKKMEDAQVLKKGMEKMPWSKWAEDFPGRSDRHIRNHGFDVIIKRLQKKQEEKKRLAQLEAQEKEEKERLEQENAKRQRTTENDD